MSFSTAQYAHRNTYREKLYSLKKIYVVSGYWNSISSHGLDPFTGNVLRSRAIMLSDGAHLSKLPQESRKFQMANHSRRARGICRCFVSLHSENCNWTKPIQIKNISMSNRQPLLPRHTTVNRTRANYKSEEYDMTGPELDSLVSSEGVASEVVLVGETKPWWEQFPKRWVIVLLCFSAFLLCNMDRVSCFLFILYLDF